MIKIEEIEKLSKELHDLCKDQAKLVAKNLKKKIDEQKIDYFQIGTGVSMDSMTSWWVIVWTDTENRKKIYKAFQEVEKEMKLNESNSFFIFSRTVKSENGFCFATSQGDVLN